MESSRSKVSAVESKAQWEDLVNKAKEQGTPIVAHFGATWCVTSFVMNPFFEELASEYADVMFVNVDVDEVKEVASMMEVKAMPTFLVLKDGIVVDKMVGANKDELRKRVEKFTQPTGANMA
ncbi:thioredoxin-like protein CXXS1 [Chenopodium quinoa]|uniref:Thioredoxin domain-containing protein n=1 Tax=Chenopodium quinoa TaxID=63459 RepID=A0A803LKW8_CHEQI|nr:thioredoxin-like protein CXXS1 [Chenopodium quinoa]